MEVSSSGAGKAVVLLRVAVLIGTSVIERERVCGTGKAPPLTVGLMSEVPPVSGILRAGAWGRGLKLLVVVRLCEVATLEPVITTALRVADEHASVELASGFSVVNDALRNLLVGTDLAESLLDNLEHDVTSSAVKVDHVACPTGDSPSSTTLELDPVIGRANGHHASLHHDPTTGRDLADFPTRVHDAQQ